MCFSSFEVFYYIHFSMQIYIGANNNPRMTRNKRWILNEITLTKTIKWNNREDPGATIVTKFQTIRPRLYACNDCSRCVSLHVALHIISRFKFSRHILRPYIGRLVRFYLSRVPLPVRNSLLSGNYILTDITRPRSLTELFKQNGSSSYHSMKVLHVDCVIIILNKFS